MEKRAVLKNYGLLGAMLAAMLTGGVTGWLWPAAAGTVRPLGQIFINLMFCVVVPLVFSSIAGAIAGMRSVRRAGRIMGVGPDSLKSGPIALRQPAGPLLRVFPLCPDIVAGVGGLLHGCVVPGGGMAAPRTANGLFLRAHLVGGLLISA